MFGRPTEETEAIYRRVDQLKNALGISLISCGEEQYLAALDDIYLPDYYDYETFDNGNILVHTLCSEIHKCGLRVMVDGGGGDEIFHGYKFRDDFGRVSGWPPLWDHIPSYYSLYTTLLAWTAKTDRAGGHFSIETRFPYQCVSVLNAAASLRITPTLKWPLREFLLNRTDYAAPSELDLTGKYGFSVKNKDLADIKRDMRAAWRLQQSLQEETFGDPLPFPFEIGRDSFLKV